MAFVWFLFAIFLFMLEAHTTQLVSIWFAIGAVAASITSFLGGFTAQFVVFVITSLVCLIVTRPLFKKKITTNFQPTNSDRNIGKIGIVTEDINNLAGTGKVMIEKEIWSAKSKDNSIIKAGDKVAVIQIVGVKVIVDSIIEIPASVIENVINN